jgi:YfiH family protein
MKANDGMINSIDGIRWLSFPSLDVYPFLLHGFIIKSQDLPPNVKTKEVKNLLHRITSRKRTLIHLSQKHRDQCVIITSRDKLKKKYTGDALLTDRDDIFISIWVADCLPIFLVEVKRKVIGLIHAGWRGTLLGIAQRSLEQANSQLGCEPGDFTVMLGPCIKSCCYQVSDDVAILFDKKCVKPDPKGKVTLDLIYANLKQLVSCGVKKERIFATGMCTVCDKDLFYSYRLNKENTGRMIGFMGLR